MSTVRPFRPCNRHLVHRARGYTCLRGARRCQPAHTPGFLGSPPAPDIRRICTDCPYRGPLPHNSQQMVKCSGRWCRWGHLCIECRRSIHSIRRASDILRPGGRAAIGNRSRRRRSGRRSVNHSLRDSRTLAPDSSRYLKCCSSKCSSRCWSRYSSRYSSNCWSNRSAPFSRRRLNSSS